MKRNRYHAIFLLASVCLLPMWSWGQAQPAVSETNPAPAQEASSKFSDEGLKFDTKNELVEIDRNRRHKEIVFDEKIKALSTGKTKIAFVREDGEEDEREVYLFEGVQVNALRFTANCTLKAIDTRVFTKIEGLTSIVFEGNVPTIIEKHGWFRSGEEDWRTNVREVVFKGKPELNKIGFCGALRTIRLAPNDATSEKDPLVEALIADSQKEKGELFAGCASLERVIIPYDLANRTDINWQKVLAKTALRNAEVVSEANEKQEKILLQLGTSEHESNISEGVTYIHGDAIKTMCDVDRTIFLPISFKGFIHCDENVQKLLQSNSKGKFALKAETTLFTPDITDVKLNNQLQESNEWTASDKLFPATQRSAALTIVSAYPYVLGEVQSGAPIDVENPKVTTWASYRPKLKPSKEDYKIEKNEENMFEASWVEAEGLSYEQNFYLNMGHLCKLRLTMEMPVVDENGMFLKSINLPVSFAKRNGTMVDEIAFSTPKQKEWWKSAFFCTLFIFIGLLIGVFLIDKAFPEGSLPKQMTQAYLKASWAQHLIFCGCIVLAVLGGHDVVPDWVACKVWAPINNYLSASFISSLVISTSTTAINMALGVLQGISIKVFGSGVDLQHTIKPITDLIGRVEMASWLATLMLGFLRMLSEILKNFGTEIWTLFGACLAARCIPGVTFGSSTSGLKVWVRRAFQIVFMVALGFPILLYCAAWFSGQMNSIAGNAFNDALNSFKLFAENLSFGAFLSLTALKELGVLLTNACSELTAASFNYIVIKLFDCFFVPLGVAFGLFHVAKSWGLMKQEAMFRGLFERQKRKETPQEAQPMVAIAEAQEEPIVLQQTPVQEACVQEK